MLRATARTTRPKERLKRTKEPNRDPGNGPPIHGTAAEDPGTAEKHPGTGQKSIFESENLILTWSRHLTKRYSLEPQAQAILNVQCPEITRRECFLSSPARWVVLGAELLFDLHPSGLLQVGSIEDRHA